MKQQDSDLDWGQEDERTVTRYLVGELSNDERTQFEERYFADDRFFEFVQAVEGRLMDDFLSGTLPEMERGQLQDLFLKSQSRSRSLNFTKELMETLRESVPAPTSSQAGASFWNSLGKLLVMQPRLIKVSFAASVLVLLVAVSWLGIETFRLRGQLGEVRSERLSLEDKAKDLERQLAQYQEQASQSARQLEQELMSLRESRGLLLTFLLNPSMGMRDETAGSARLIIPRTTQTVRLQLFLPPGDAHRSFQAQLETVEGHRAWSQVGLEAVPIRARKAVTLTIPANALVHGHYLITLMGMTAGGQSEPLSSYDFSVVRR